MLLPPPGRQEAEVPTRRPALPAALPAHECRRLQGWSSPPAEDKV